MTLIGCVPIGSLRHGRLLAECGLAVECRDAAPGRLCWYPVRRQAVGESGAAVFLSWPPRSGAALESLEGVEVLILVADRGAWHGSKAFHQALEPWELLFQHRIACWPRLHDDLRILRKRPRPSATWSVSRSWKPCRRCRPPRPPRPSMPQALRTRRRLSVARGLSPDVLQNLLQEQHRDLPEPPAPSKVANGAPLVISVAEALAPAEPKDLRTTVMLRNLPNNYTPPT